MIPLVSLRWSRTLYLLPVLTLASIIVSVLSVDVASSYSGARLAAAYRGLVLVSPLLAAFTAWHSADLQRYLAIRNSVRHRTTALANALWPLFASAVIALMIAVSMASARGALSSWSARWMATTTLAALIASGCVGILCGQILPRPIAIPTAGIALFLWHTIPTSTSPSWLRYLNASFVTCCTPEQQVADLAHLGSTSAAAVWISGSLILLLTQLSKRSMAIAAIGVVMLGLLVGRALVGPEPSPLTVEARKDQPICEQTDLTVCVWPENSSRLTTAVALVSDVRRRLSTAGVETPHLYSESPIEPPGAIRIEVADRGTETDQRFSIAIGLLPDISACSNGDGSSNAGHQAYDDLLGWLSLQAGLTLQEISARIPEDVANDVAQVSEGDLQMQQEWYTERRTVLAAACG